MNCKINFLLGTLLMFSLSCSESNGKKDTVKDVEAFESNSEIALVTDVDDRGYIVSVGDMAPDFNLKTTTGKSFRLSDMRGKIVMLQFTASWCSVCRKEMPFIERDIWQKHKDNSSFFLIGVDRDEPVETVNEFAKQTGITYPIALDPEGDVFALYAERKAGITRNVIIDKTGKIVMLTRLYNEEEFSAMCKKIDEMLK